MLRKQLPAVLPVSCTRHLAHKVPKLPRRLHLAAAPSKAMQSVISMTQGEHAYLVQQSCH